MNIFRDRNGPESQWKDEKKEFDKDSKHAWNGRPRTTSNSKVNTYHLYLCIFLSMDLSFYVSFYHCIFLSMYLSIYVYFDLCIFLSMYIFIYVFIFIYLSIYLSFYLSIYISIYLVKKSTQKIQIHLMFYQFYKEDNSQNQQVNIY